MNKVVKWLSPVMFCLFLFFIAVTLFACPDQKYSEKEKRYLEAMPTFSFESALDGTYQAQLEDWIADQFPARDFWVGLHAYSQLLLGRNALQSIYMTSDGYLVNAPATQDLSDFRKNISRFDNFAEKSGLPATLIMVPSTGSLHHESLPTGHSPYPDEQMYLDAAENARYLEVLDFRSVLEKADEVKPVAYRTDHHLTSYGNYVLYTSFRHHAGKDFLSEDQYAVEVASDFYGTTWSGSGYWLTQPDELEIWDSGIDVEVSITDDAESQIISESMFFRQHLIEMDKYPVFLDGNHALTKISNLDAEGDTLLIIKDSYAHGFAPFLAEYYQTIFLLDLRYYRGNISEFVAANGIDELLFLYGTSTLLTDTNSAWLF